MTNSNTAKNSASHSIFILKSKNETLRSAEEFLGSTGWTLSTSTSVKTALAQITAQKPRFVLISVENSFQSLRQLPQLIAQAFPEIRIVLFADTSTTQNFNALTDWGHDYTLYPPVTGPSIERMLVRIERDLEGARQARLRSQATTPTVDETSLQDQAQEKLRMLVTGVADSETPPEPKSVASAPAYEGGAGFRGIPLPEIPQPKNSVAIDRMARATEQALEITSESESVGDGERVSIVTRISCISVQSRDLSGYLIAAYGEDREIDTEFLTTMRKRLVTTMHLDDQSFSTDNELDLTLTEVPFEGWAREQAEFLKKSIHFGHEIAMAFFPPMAPQPELEISASEEMVMIDMNEIVGDAPVDFDLYVYLPMNKRYVLYTRRGDRLPTGQRDRLASKGVTKMHLPKEAKSEVRRYRARNYLNQKIAAFKRQAASGVA